MNGSQTLIKQSRIVMTANTAAAASQQKYCDC